MANVVSLGRRQAGDSGDDTNTRPNHEVAKRAVEAIDASVRKSFASIDIPRHIVSVAAPASSKASCALKPSSDANPRQGTMRGQTAPDARGVTSIPHHSAMSSGTYADMFRLQWSQLIIIGNGFDVQCKLRSRFEDFFKPRFASVADISDNKRATWERLVNSKLGLTIWDIVLERETETGFCWYEVEGAIGRLVLARGEQENLLMRALNDDFRSDPFADDAMDRDFKSTGMNADSLRTYWRIRRILWVRYHKVIHAITNLSYLLRTEITFLEAAFGDYLKDEVEKNEEYAGRCWDLYRFIEQDGKPSGREYETSTSLLSFNYTDVIGKYFDGGRDGDFVNIHGKLGEEIVFGIDGQGCMDNPDAVPFTKTYRLMLRGGSLTGKLIGTANSANLEGATDVIKFYGHSLSEADYSYFHSIFDGVDLYESKTVLVFYYPADTSETFADLEWRDKLTVSINRLLVTYGDTMSNKSHGRNLMHKLLLEGRLFLRGIPVDSQGCIQDMRPAGDVRSLL